MVTAGNMPATVRWNVSGHFSRTGAASPHHAVMLRPRAGEAWPPPDLFQQGDPWTRPAGPRRLASSSRWVSRGVPASSSRPSRAGPCQHVWPPARPVCSSARATPLGPPRPIHRLSHPPAALALRDDRAPRQGPRPSPGAAGTHRAPCGAAAALGLGAAGQAPRDARGWRRRLGGPLRRGALPRVVERVADAIPPPDEAMAEQARQVPGHDLDATAWDQHGVLAWLWVRVHPPVAGCTGQARRRPAALAARRARGAGMVVSDGSAVSHQWWHGRPGWPLCAAGPGACPRHTSRSWRGVGAGC
jgi:hypothetical protein